MTFNTVGKVGSGAIICAGLIGITIAGLRRSNLQRLLGFPANQVLQWMPGFVNHCLGSLRQPATITGMDVGYPNEALELSSLPQELKTEIQQYLEPTDRQALSQVNWDNRQTTDKFGAALGYMRNKVSDGKPITIHEIRELTILNPNFSSSMNFKLDLSSSDVSDNDLKNIISKFPGIIEINANSCSSLTDAGLQYLANLTNLTRLSLDGCLQITDVGLQQHLAKLTNLTILSLRRCLRITNAGLQPLVNLTNLRRLNLAGCRRITDVGLQHLANLTNLRSLVLAGCRRITNAGLQPLANFKKLRVLNLAGCHQITEAGLLPLANSTTLTSLNLARCSQITGAGLRHLATLTTLRRLNLEGCTQIFHAALASLAHLENLIIDGAPPMPLLRLWLMSLGLI